MIIWFLKTYMGLFSYHSSSFPASSSFLFNLIPDHHSTYLNLSDHILSVFIFPFSLVLSLEKHPTQCYPIRSLDLWLLSASPFNTQESGQKGEKQQEG